MKLVPDQVAAFIHRHFSEANLLRKTVVRFSKSTHEVELLQLDVKPGLDYPLEDRSLPVLRFLSSRSVRRSWFAHLFFSLRLSRRKMRCQSAMKQVIQDLKTEDPKQAVDSIARLYSRMTSYFAYSHSELPSSIQYGEMLKDLLQSIPFPDADKAVLAQSLQPGGTAYKVLVSISCVQSGRDEKTQNILVNNLGPKASNIMTMACMLPSELFKFYCPDQAKQLEQSWLRDSDIRKGLNKNAEIGMISKAYWTLMEMD